MKECVSCESEISDSDEFNRGINRKGQSIFMCEECDDYGDKNINYYENKE